MFKMRKDHHRIELGSIQTSVYFIFIFFGPSTKQLACLRTFHRKRVSYPLMSSKHCDVFSIMPSRFLRLSYKWPQQKRMFSMGTRPKEGEIQPWFVLF